MLRVVSTICIAPACLLLAGCFSYTETTMSSPPATAAVEAPVESAETASSAPIPAAETAPIPAETAAAPAAAPADAVTLKILTFDEIQALVKSHKGKIVVMDCWSTSCEPCIKEFPNLVALHQKYGPKVACISFSFDYEGLAKPEEVHPAVLKFLKEKQATFDNVMSSEDSETLYKKLELASIPAVYVYDRQGNLAKRFDNEQIKKPEDAFTYKDVEALVEQLLAPKTE